MEIIVAYFKILFQHSLARLTEVTLILSQNNRSVSRRMNPGFFRIRKCNSKNLIATFIFLNRWPPCYETRHYVISFSAVYCYSLLVLNIFLRNLFSDKYNLYGF
jgi:hypothetical protein